MNKILFIAAIIFGFLAHAETTPAPTLSDAQIVQVLMEINDGEIDAGKRADSKAQNNEVEKYGQKMVSEHKKNTSELKKIAKRNKIDANKSDVSRAVEDNAEKMYKDLKDADKASFDKMFLDQQITMHEKALAMLGETLLPSVKNTDIKAHLEQTKSHVMGHLSEARALRSKIQ